MFPILALLSCTAVLPAHDCDLPGILLKPALNFFHAFCVNTALKVCTIPMSSSFYSLPMFPGVFSEERKYANSTVSSRLQVDRHAENSVIFQQLSYTAFLLVPA